MFNSIYKDRRILITGHTGFKGSWLALWLTEMGSEVVGYSLEPPTSPSHFEVLNIPMTSIIGDIRDFEKICEIFRQYQPEIVFHMAAQPLVRHSYKEPKETFEINVMGTINVFEACRKTSSVKAVVNITSDKCYENKEWIWGYRENDPMGGYDPYSASKGCSELVTTAYRNSFFYPDQYGKTHQILLASARSGNVIGGGDWAEDRLIPDIMRAVSRKEKVFIRNPIATRPWQHVLEPLSGYLHLGQKLSEGKMSFAQAWNFGPADESAITVENVVNHIKRFWNTIDYEIQNNPDNPHEAELLKLDCSKAHIQLGWKSVWNSLTTFKRTTEWYKKYYEQGTVSSLNDLNRYIRDAQEKQTEWAMK